MIMINLVESERFLKGTYMSLVKKVLGPNGPAELAELDSRVLEAERTGVLQINLNELFERLGE